MFAFIARLARLALSIVCAVGLTLAVYPDGSGELPALAYSQVVSYGLRGFPFFGFEVDLEGTVAAASTPYGNSRVYEYNGSQWQQVLQLEGSYGIATDGTRVIAQEIPTTSVAVWAGPSPWSQEAFVTLGQNGYSFWDKSVDIFGERFVATGTDAVEVWERLNGTWTRATTLVGADTQPGDEFARSVALYDRVAVAGAPAANGGIGAAYVFQKVGGQWLQVVKLEPPGGVPGWRFGEDVAVHGNELAVGAPGYEVDPEDAGAVFTYRQAGPAWNPSGTLVHDTSIGSSLDLNDDWLIAGSNSPEAGFPTGPTAPVWHRRNGTWTKIAKLSSTNPLVTNVAAGTAIQDGWAMTGAPYFQADGLVFFYPLETPPATFCTGKLNSDGCIGTIDSCGLPSVTQAVDFDITAANVLGQKPGILIYGYGTAATPFLGGTLCIQPPLRRTPTVLSSGDATPCSGAFTFDFDTWIKTQADPLLIAGASAVAQYWHRDPAGSFGAGLTDALMLTVWP